MRFYQEFKQVTKNIKQKKTHVNFSWVFYFQAIEIIDVKFMGVK